MSEKTSGWRKLLISLVVLTAAVVVVVSVSRMPARTEDVPPKEELSVNVKVVTVQAIAQMLDFLELPGTLEPNLEVDVPVEMQGSIAEITRKEGAVIREGDILLKLDTALLQAEFDRAKAQADFDKSTLDRTKALLAKGVLNRSQLEEAEARAVVSSAVFAVARTNLERAVVKAPVSGILNTLPKDQGEYVSKGDTVARIVDVSRMKAVVHVPERDVHYVRAGSNVDLSVDAVSDVSLAGKVTYISEIADALTHTSRVEVTVNNTQKRLHSGMIVRARILRRRLRNVIMIPLSAVIPLEDARAVYVVAAGRAEQRLVELGVTKGSDVQVLNGLSPGESLIVSGHRLVGPGQSVRIAD